MNGPRLRRAALTVALSLAGGYLLLVLGLVAWQRRLLFPAGAQKPLPVGNDLELLRWSGPAGDLVALRLQGPPEAPTVVHFHGNGEQLADVVPLGRALRARGFSVLLAEYPGYGPLQDQTASEQTILAAARSLLAHVQGPWGVPVARTVLLGQSLGSGVALALAAAGRAHRVVRVSPFTSLPAVAGVHYPFVPARWLLRDRLDSLGRAPRVPVPVLILHGDQDELVPYTLGEALARALPDARLVPLVGGGHNDLWARFEGPMLDEIERHARGVR